MRPPNPAICAKAAQAAWDTARPSVAPASIVVRCKLITPMYGGGVRAGEVDCDLPVRPSALRGQLRYWWRLLNGAGKTSEEVFRAESTLWGGISSTGPQASRVSLQVKAPAVDAKRLIKGRTSTIPTYALILEGDDNPDLLATGYEFELTLRFQPRVTSAQCQQVIEALRWWASFAGVGARTRRGFGAVRGTGVDAAVKPISVDEIESRGGVMVLGSGKSDALEAWKVAVDALKTFRQGAGVGRNPGRHHRPGRSRWPEPDAIRRRTGRHAPGHEPQHPVNDFYPRAAFGLPIVFHFKDKDDPGTGRDERPPVLVPNRGDRMASPLILRPYFDGQQYHPMALLLPGWEKRVSVSAGFDPASAKPAWPEAPKEREQMATLIQPMKDRGADVLSAFMSYFASFDGSTRNRDRRQRGYERR